jgi:23S rRNA pseudouridine1911/1915/1917 synthase
MHYEPSVRPVGEDDRPGIVHRLDKDTSGLLILARTPYAHKVFTGLFADRKIHKTYLALVVGTPPRKGDITIQIDRHPTLRTRMAAVTHSGRPAHTFYTTLEQYPASALLKLNPTTGRTHQIRVHCAHIGHALVGDSVYGTRSPHIARHALHAHRLVFTFDGIDHVIESPMPQDMIDAQERLRLGDAQTCAHNDDTVSVTAEELWCEDSF